MMDDYRSASIMIEVPTCQACGSAGDLRYCGVKDHVFKFPGKFSYFECTECGSLWLNPRLQADDLSNAYANYYTHGAVSAGSAPGGGRAKRIVRLLPWHIADRRGEIAYLDGIVAGRALDVGCGDGRTVAQLQQCGWMCTGIDPDPASIVTARGLGVENVRVATIEDVDPSEGPFDAIISVHSIEHVSEPDVFLRHAFRLLAPGGVLSAVTPNASSLLRHRFGSSWRGLEAPRHLQVFTPDGLSRLVQSVGFSILEVSSSARGANGIARESTGRLPTSALGRIVRYGIGEAWQAREWWMLHRRPLIGEELVVMAQKQ